SNIFESINKLIKTGKAKFAFDWSATTLDSGLLADAQARGIDLELADVADVADEQPQQTRVAEWSIFGDIGQPGTFTSLYDEDQLLVLPDRQKTDQRQQPETDQRQQPDTDQRQQPEAPDTVMSSGHMQVLYSATPEDMADLGILDSFDMSSLDNFQASPPPTPPALAIPSLHTPMVPDVVRRTASADDVMVIDTPPAVSAIDDELLAFDISTSDIVVLSDEDTVDNATPEPPAPVKYKLSQRHQNLGDLDADMSSSPLIRRRGMCRANRNPAPSDTSAGDPLAMFASSSPVQLPRRLGSRLVRGRPPAAEDSESSVVSKIVRSPRPVLSVMPTKEKKKRGLRRPPKPMNHMFFDAEAAIGYSDDDDDNANNRGRRVQVSDDEGDGDDLDQELSSFIVDDDHVDFDTPGTLERVSDQARSGHNQSPTRHIGDIYRRSLLSPTTPVSEIMKRLAEREKERRWVSDMPDTPTRGQYSNGHMLGDSIHDPVSDSIDSNSSDFESS
ncbi:hypothetical protein LPJ58_000831, partial [Coemansia sp. RSA 1591]